MILGKITIKFLSKLSLTKPGKFAVKDSILIFLTIILIQSCTQNKVWSPESSGILFSSNRNGNLEIYTKQANDTSWINLTANDAGDNWPVWSPDGNKIVFQSTRSGKLDVWIMNNDGTDQRRLTSRPDHDYRPSITPDGTQITFTSWRTESRDEDRAPHIYYEFRWDKSDKIG